VRTGYALISWARGSGPTSSPGGRPDEYELSGPRSTSSPATGGFGSSSTNALSEIESSWQVDLGHIKKVRDRYLIYE
jgi:hypothetical protein